MILSIIVLNSLLILYVMSNFTPYYYYYYYADWVPGGVYHVYNRAVHLNRLFLSRTDHFKFSEKVLGRICNVAEIFSYAYILNHFHLSLRLISEDQLLHQLAAQKKLSKPEKSYLDGSIDFGLLMSFYWGNALKSYTLSVNKRRNRSGPLYEGVVRRICVRQDAISRRLIMYHHTNEMHHGLANDYTEQTERSSFGHYKTYNYKNYIAVNAVLNRFGGLSELKDRHENYARKFGNSLRSFDERK